MTKRERDANEEIDKEFGTVISSDPKRKRFKTKSIKAVVDAFIGDPETPFCSLLMHCTKDLKHSPRWDTYKGDHAEYFFFHNHAAGQLMHVSQKNNITFDKLSDSLWDPAVLADLKRIGTSLPFFFFSLFVNLKDMQFLSPENLEIVCFNKDSSKAHLYCTEDPENGRIACNPYFLFMDKFTRYFINTGHFQYSFAQPPILDESQLNKKNDKETKTLMSILEGVIFADIYPLGNAQHEDVMADRKMLLEQTDLLLKDVLVVGTVVDKVEIKDVTEESKSEMTDE